jgi:imidazolonepropionase-like amidohydrolase
MSNRTATIAILIIASATPGSAQTPASDLAIVGVDVIDVVTGRRVPDQTIIVHGSRISNAGPRARVAVPKGAQVVDGRSKYLMPGLWDMHGHVYSHSARPGTDDHALQFPLYIAMGVTGVRDMWTNLEDFAQVGAWNNERAAGQLLTPRILATGPMLNGPNGILKHVLLVTSAADARRAVDSLADGGAKAIKIHSAVSREAYFALAARAKERGLPLIGHVPAGITVLEAARAGQQSIEHYGIGDGCASEEAEAEATRMRADRSQRPPAGKVQQIILEGYDERRCAALLGELARLGVWQVPTLVASRFRLDPSDSERTARPELRYVPGSERAAWQRAHDAGAAGTPPALALIRRNVFAQQVRLVGAMQRAGVPLLIGTDVSNAWLVPGYSVHDELALFVQAGLTPAEALRAATLSPARYAGMTDSLGTVAAGQLADLVLLDADPLSDIHNTTRIHAVFVNGRYLDRLVLDSLLADVERAAR